ncbi:MAG: hypothetical protein OXH00_22900 [Candidatus Poribacteria bacterium]|nr:hypothetical protein [Candidatus Poribacteria bacterium]
MNKYEGGSFDDFLKEEGIFEEVTEYTLKRLQILRLADIVKVLIQRETAFVEEVKSDVERDKVRDVLRKHVSD